jgi:hypothetical protein
MGTVQQVADGVAGREEALCEQRSDGVVAAQGHLCYHGRARCGHAQQAHAQYVRIAGADPAAAEQACAVGIGFAAHVFVDNALHEAAAVREKRAEMLGKESSFQKLAGAALASRIDPAMAELPTFFHELNDVGVYALQHWYPADAPAPVDQVRIAIRCDPFLCQQYLTARWRSGGGRCSWSVHVRW